MDEDNEIVQDGFNPPRLHKENVDYSYLLTQVLHEILNLSKNDLTNDISNLNKITNSIDYLALFVMPLADNLYFKDLEVCHTIKNQEFKTKAVWLAVISLLSRRKLLFKRQKEVTI